MKQLVNLFALLIFATQAQAHCANCKNEEIFDVVFDVVFVTMDVVEIVTTGSGWAALSADLACTAIPGATGGGTAVRAVTLAKNGHRVVQTTKVTNKVTTTLTTKARALMLKGKVPKMSIPKQHLDDMYTHILQEHATLSTSGKSLFFNVADVKQLDYMFKTIGTAINKGNVKAHVDAVGDVFTYTMYINLGTKVGSKGESWVALFYVPSSTGFIGTCFPMTNFKVQTKLAEIGHIL